MNPSVSEFASNGCPRDTTPAAQRMYFETLRKMPGVQRVQMAFQLSNDMRARLEAGVRFRHSDYDEEQVRLATVRLMLGQSLFKKVFPGCEVIP